MPSNKRRHLSTGGTPRSTHGPLSTHLEAHVDGSYDVQITIHKDDPPYAFIKGASIGWSLVAVFDVARAVDVKTGKDLNVAFTPTGA